MTADYSAVLCIARGVACRVPLQGVISGGKISANRLQGGRTFRVECRVLETAVSTYLLMKGSM